jgi:hypothetical protein
LQLVLQANKFQTQQRETNVAYWHVSDMSAAHEYVRLSGVERKSSADIQNGAFDPEADI